MSDLTPRQSEVLELIRQVIENTGRPPTRAEIAEHLGFSSANAAETHLRALAKKGVIELSPGSSRGIRLVETEEPGLPVVGRVAAGTPILAEEHVETRYRMDPEVFQPRAHYLLQVKGMSMQDVGIFEGDLVAVHRATDFRNGQIVVARLDDEVTVKRFKQRGKQIWLLPENEEFEPIEVDLETQTLVLEGVVVGVIRNGRIQ